MTIIPISNLSCSQYKIKNKIRHFRIDTTLFIRETEQKVRAPDRQVQGHSLLPAESDPLQTILENNSNAVYAPKGVRHTDINKNEFFYFVIFSNQFLVVWPWPSNILTRIRRFRR